MTNTCDTAAGIRQALAAHGEAASQLRGRADRVRARHYGSTVYVWALVVFSNYCRRACPSCQLNRLQDIPQRYRLSTEEVMGGIRHAWLAGIKTVVLHAAEDDGLDPGWLREIIVRTRGEYGLSVIISAGVRTPHETEMWRSAGGEVVVYRSHQHHAERDDRLNVITQALGALRQEERIYAPVEQIIPFLGSLRVDPAPADKELMLNTLALIRIMSPFLHLPAPVIQGNEARDFLRQGLGAGADLLLQDYTPSPYSGRHNYSAVQECLGATRRECGNCLEKIVQPIGRHIDMSFI